MPFAVDHAVVNVLEQMDDAVARFTALGFTLTERGYHSLGSINHLMVFGHDYLELVGIERGAAKVRREVADSPLGLNGLVFRTGNARRLHEELMSAGVPALPPVDFDRPVQFENRTEVAAFTTVRIDPEWIAGGRVYFCEHKTPHLVWQPAWQTHANGAVALAGLSVVVPDPRAEGRHYERLMECTAASGEDGEVTLDLAAFRLTLMTADRYRDRYGDFGCSDSLVDGKGARTGRSAYMGAVAIRSASAAQLRHCLADAVPDGVQWRDDGERITIAAASAFDCAIDFVR